MGADRLDFDANSEVLPIRVGGKDYDLRYPTLGELEKIQEKIDNNKEDGSQTEDVKRFLVNCGLGEEAFSLLTVKQLQHLSNELLSVKKS